MFELLVESIDINALVAIYISIYIGITLKLLWAQMAETDFYGSISETAGTQIIYPAYFYHQKITSPQNTILVWIIKYIRRRKSSMDEPDLNPPLQYSY